MAGHEIEHGHGGEHGVVETHRHEQPEDWGWHGEWGKWARVGGWVSAVLLCLVNVTTHYNRSQDPWLYGLAATIVIILLWDRNRRKNAWRG